jgi:hypothetical protein
MSNISACDLGRKNPVGYKLHNDLESVQSSGLRMIDRRLRDGLPQQDPATCRKDDHQKDAFDKLPRTGVLGGSVVCNSEDQSKEEDGPGGRAFHLTAAQLW